METSTVSTSSNPSSTATLMITNVDSTAANKSPQSTSSTNKSPLSTTSLDTGQMRSTSPFTPNSFPIHKSCSSSLMSSSSPPAAATAGSPLSNDTTRLSPSKEPTLLLEDQKSVAASLNDDTESVTSSLSDVETFNGKIVYNPDGSAYIIEGPDSDGSEVEAEISQEGSIIDARGHSPNYGSISFPQIVSAFHISRSSAANAAAELYSSLCGSAAQSSLATQNSSAKNTTNTTTESTKVSEIPVMHSYRVFTLRNNNKKENSTDSIIKQENGIVDDDHNFDEDDDQEENDTKKLRAVNSCTTVPVKPILMCFICKLSFGYTKSFVAHAIGEHHLVLNDDEKRVLFTKNTSAIIQGVGKEKEPLLSFLQPKSSPAPFRTNNNLIQSQQQQQQIDAQRLLAVQMAAMASALRSTTNNLSSSTTTSATTTPSINNLTPKIQNNSSSTTTVSSSSSSSSSSTSNDLVTSTLINKNLDGNGPLVINTSDDRTTPNKNASHSFSSSSSSIQQSTKIDDDVDDDDATEGGVADGEGVDSEPMGLTQCKDSEDNNSVDNMDANNINKNDSHHPMMMLNNQFDKTSTTTSDGIASQFANELADLANLEKFAQAAAAAAAAQQQQMDLHSIAAVMAAVASASSNSNPNNNNNKSSSHHQIRTPSPASAINTPTKVSSPKNSQSLINTSQMPNVSNTTTFNNGIPDVKSISSLFNSSPTESVGGDQTSNLLATVANHVQQQQQRPTLNASHPPLLMQHSRNSCKTLKCPKCNWHYKYQETLEIHMKEKHPENEMNCMFCLTNQAHPRLARGETYTCGYKPYRCDVCNYSTTTKGNLSIHMQSDKHINNVQELQNGNIPATAEHLLQSQALAAAVAQASAAAVAANGTTSIPSTVNSNVNSSGSAVVAITTNSNSVSPTPSTSVASMAVQDCKRQLQVKMSQSSNSSNHPNTSSTPSSSHTPPSTPNTTTTGSSKQKATWRCDVCNYETNVARNLRIHMTSEKHTHNIMVLKQNVTQMQQLNAIQQGMLNPEQLLQLNPGFFAAAAAAAVAGIGGANNSGQTSSGETPATMQPEVALADMAYNHALLMMASQQQQRTMAALMQQHQQQLQQTNDSKTSPSSLMVNGLQATFDIENPDVSLANIANSIPIDECCQLYHCCVCGKFTTDSIEALNQHLPCDRKEDGSYICNLCNYTTNLKANLQLHFKTDKHMQRMQHFNHNKDGGTMNNMSNVVQVIRCNVCNYYTNSITKLQLHSANPRHDVYTRIYNHLQLCDISTNNNNTVVGGGSGNNTNGNNKYYYCNLCSVATSTKIKLIQHLNTFKHVRNENLKQLKLQTIPNNSGNNNNNGIKNTEEEIREMFLVKELRPGDNVIFETDDELTNTIGSPTTTPFDNATCNTTDPLLIKNALMEQVKLSLQQNNDQNNEQQQQSQPQQSISINCPFCSYSNTSEIRVQMHILTNHHHQTPAQPQSSLSDQSTTTNNLQQQQQQNNSSTTNNNNNNTAPGITPPSVLCPLCQESFQEKIRIENHLVEVHNVTKEGVQRLMSLVDTSELDKFATTSNSSNNNNKMLMNEDRSRDMNDTNQPDDEDGDGRPSECDSADGSSFKMMTDDDMMMMDTSNMMLMSNNNSNTSAIIEHLICPTCNRVLLNLEELFNHMTIESHMKTTPNGQFQCWRNNCSQTFKTIAAVQQHFKDQHFSKCVKLTNSSANLASNAPVSDRHVYKYRCSQCSLAFKTFEKLQLHSQYHLIRAATQCVICGRSFRSVDSLQKHVETSHSNLNEEELEQYKTNLMNNQLLFALGRNGGILDPSTTELLKKESCRSENMNDDESMDIDNASGAIDLVNSNKDCDESGPQSLFDQMDSSTNPSTMLINSDNSGTSNPIFNGNLDNSNLEDYLNQQQFAEDNYNDPARKFKCHRCKVAFTRQSYLTSHNKTLLHRKGEKMSYPMEKYLDPNRPFKCEICKESFTQKNILLVHYNSVSHLHKLKQSMKESSAAVAALVSSAQSSSNPPVSTTNESEEECNNENKLFKCNLCKVSYSMASSLHSHLRSSLHQTRTSKLHELAQSGQLDLSLPLIEPLNNFDSNSTIVSSSKANNVESSIAKTTTTTTTTNQSSCSSPVGNNSSKFPEMLANLNEQQQQQALALQQAALNLALSSGAGNSGAQNSTMTDNPAQQPQQLMQINGQSPFTCSKCGAAFISQDAQVQHQQLCGLFGNITNVNMALAAQAKQQLSKLSSLQGPLYKNKPQLYKHLLETWGFEIVMQFNESNQKKKKSDSIKQEDEDFNPGDETEKSANTPPPNQPQQEQPQQQSSTTEKSEEQENENIPPEINKCQCDICLKEFSSIWVLKAHREEIHKDVVPLDVVESFADEYRNEYDRKFSNGNDDEATEDSTTQENQDNNPNNQTTEKISNKNSNNNNQNSSPSQICQNNSTPNESNINAAGTGNGIVGENDQIPNMSSLSPNGANNLVQLLPNLSPNATPAEIAAANQMAAHIQISQLLMSMGLANMAAGMPMPAGMNVPFAAAAAMGIPPQLIPVMMADPVMAAAAAFNNPALAAAAAAAQMNQVQGGPVPSGASAAGTPSPAPTVTPTTIPVQPPPVVNPSTLNPQNAAVAAAAASVAQQQKRARTRISDEQLKVLRQYFDINNSPTEEQLIEMSHKSGLPMKVIKHWFRNTLFKERQRNKDSPYNFNNPPSTFLNLDEYEKTGEAKVFTLDDLKKTDTTIKTEDIVSKDSKATKQPQQQQPPPPPPQQPQQQQQQDKPNDSESECEGKNSSDLKSSSSNKDTDYATSDDEEIKQRTQSAKEIMENINSEINSIAGQLPKMQTCSNIIQQQQQAQQEFEQLSKTMSFNMNSPQPSESSMSSACESNNAANTSSLFAGLANFSPGLSASQNMASSPLQLALDAAQRSQLAVAAAAVAANSSNILSTTPPSVGSHSSSGKRANRTRFTDYQIKVLQEFFESNAYPKDDDLEYLSKLLNLSPRVIVVWFQNARQKARKVYENQPPTTPVGEDDGSGRFQRTPGLNYQCKKCLQVFQRYYELIKHQKSSCFKDENPLAAQIRMAAEARAQATSPSVSRDSSSTPIDCTRSATATPEKMPTMNMLTSPNSATSPPSLSCNNNSSNNNNNKTSPNHSSNETQTFRCDKCPMVFNRLDLWRDHQIVHIVNSNLFNPAANPFGLMQMDGGSSQVPPPPPLSPQQSPNPLSIVTTVSSRGTKRKTITSPTTDDDDDDEEEESRDFDSMSGNGNSNSSDQTPRDKRLRTTILPEQLDYLYQKYQVDSNPSRKMLESIAKEVGLKKRVVQVWFQNTRARERKGQFRAHQQVIHKRCPFCRALFKARSALESHLATRHADQYTKGDINIDTLPDGDPSEDGDSPINEVNMEGGGSGGSQMVDVMKRYEDSFKKYFDELNIQGKDGGRLPAELAFKMMSAIEQSTMSNNNPNDFADNDDAAAAGNSIHFPQLNQLDDTIIDDDCSGEFDSDAEDEIDYDQSSSPSSGFMSPNNNTGRINKRKQNNSKRYRTQMTTTMIKVMKSIFADYKTPTMAECQALGKELGLAKRVVQVWFQNARAKEKKARSAFMKTFGQDFDNSNQIIDQCKVCNIKYNTKQSSTFMQEHLFSKSHIDRLKNHIDNVAKTMEGQEDNSTDFPIASGNPISAIDNISMFPTTSTNTTPMTNNNDNNDNSNADNNAKAAQQFLQQLQMIQSLAAQQQQNGQVLPPFNIEDLINNMNGNIDDINSNVRLF